MDAYRVCMEGSKPPKRSAKKSAEETPRILRLEFPFPTGEMHPRHAVFV